MRLAAGFPCLVGACLLLGQSAAAQAAGEDRLARDCGKIYAKLCTDVPAGQDRLLLCQDKHPDLAVPAKCQADYQSAIEGIVDAKGGACVTAAKSFCHNVSAKQAITDFFAACKTQNPKVFLSLPAECGRLFNP